MDYIKNFYESFKLIINPKPPIKTNYYYKPNYLIRNAKYQPIFKDEFKEYKPVKYNSVYNTKVDEELI